MKTEQLTKHLPQVSEHVEIIRNMYEGELLGPNLEYWLGPGVAPSFTGQNERVSRLKLMARAEQQSAVRNSFVSGENMIAGSIDRILHHVGGAEPTWSITALTDVQKALAEAVILAAWNRNALHGLMGQHALGIVRDGGGGLRMRVPRGAIDNARIRTRDPLIAAGMLRVEVSDLENSEVWEDEDTLTPASVCRVPQGPKEPPMLETARIEAGLTLLNEVDKHGEELELYRLDLSGHVPHIVARVRPAVSMGTERMQMGQQMALTMAVKNSELAGFVERWMHNIAPQLDADGNAVPIITGPGMTIMTTDDTLIGEDGSEKRITGGKYERMEPVSSAPLDALIDTCRSQFYAAMHQSHYLLNGDGAVGEESRKTAMAGFEASLRPYQAAYKESLRQLLQLILDMSAALCGKPGMFVGVGIEVRLTDRVTTPSPAERAQSLSEWEKGAISHETFLADRGTLEPAAEREQIAREAAEQPATTEVPA